MLLELVEMKADDVANWPNVSFQFVPTLKLGSKLAQSLSTV